MQNNVAKSPIIFMKLNENQVGETDVVRSCCETKEEEKQRERKRERETKREKEGERKRERERERERMLSCLLVRVIWYGHQMVTPGASVKGNTFVEEGVMGFRLVNASYLRRSLHGVASSRICCVLAVPPPPLLCLSVCLSAMVLTSFVIRADAIRADVICHSC